MQNKANLHQAKMNARPIKTKDYENKSAFSGLENKAKQSQFPNRKTDDRRQKPAPSASSGLVLSKAEGAEYGRWSFSLGPLSVNPGRTWG
jgi:hypothetical protein